MNSKKEGWSAHDGYTAVANSQAVNICMAEDLIGDNDKNASILDGKFVMEGKGNICKNHNNISNGNLTKGCMGYTNNKNDACC